MTIKRNGDRVILKNGKVSCSCCACIGSSGLNSERHLILPRSLANDFYNNATSVIVDANLSWEGRTNFPGDPPDPPNYWVSYTSSGSSSFGLSKVDIPGTFCFPRGFNGLYSITGEADEGSFPAGNAFFYGLFFQTEIFSGGESIPAPQAQKLSSIPNSDLIINTQFNFSAQTYGSLIGGTLDSIDGNPIGGGWSSTESTMEISIFGNEQSIPTRINYFTERTRNFSVSFRLIIS